MPNMSYCRFTNTLGDLRDCRDALADGEYEQDEMNEEERRACESLLLLCEEIAGDFENEIDDIREMRAKKRTASA